MTNVTINQLPSAATIDATQDLLPIYTASLTATQAITRNTYLGIAGSPVGTSDTQTLTNKTLTAPTISSPVFSGTLTGTYTIGGTPTFPSSVVTLTGSQTLTNKTMTSPIINSPTITNATISADTVTGYTTSNSGTIYGISVALGVMQFNNGLTVTGGTTTITGSILLNGTYLGWIGANETWSYSSYDSTNKTGVITVPSDATTKYSKGMRVMFTNNSATQYGIITGVTSTTLTIYFGTDYSLTNSAITAPYYSSQKAPFGFPLDPSKWTVTTSNTGNCSKASPTAGTWYGDTGLSATGPNISVPIGAWKLSYEAPFYFNKSASTVSTGNVSLSTSSSSASDSDFTCYFNISGASGGIAGVSAAYREKFVSVAAATVYYIVIESDTASMTSIALRGDLGGPTIIKAVCAYL